MGERIVVLGSQGFVGNVLSNKLLKLDRDVVFIDILDNPSSDLTRKYQKIDLLSITEDKLVSIFKNSIVVHLAALSTSAACEKDSEKALDVNLKVTKRVIDSANNANARLIFASSEWVYPDNSSSLENLETDFLSLSQDTNYYAMTKLVGEWLVQRYSKVFTILRFGIIYGERMIPQSAIESIVHRAIKREITEIGSLKTSRRFIHVEDLCDGIIKVIENSSKLSDLFNLAGSELVSLEDILIQLGKEIETEVQYIVTMSNPSVRNAISNKFYDTFQWQPAISLQKGLVRLVEFYQGMANGGTKR